MSEDREKMDRAREAARALLQEEGKSSRELGRERLLEGLKWVHKWGWSTPNLIDHYCGVKNRSLARRWEKQGLCQFHLLPASMGSFFPIPRYAVTLTEMGAAAIEQSGVMRDYFQDGFAPYQYTIPTKQLLHDYTVQKQTLLLLDQWGGAFRSPREMTYFYGSPADLKEADAEVFVERGEDIVEKIGIEIELTEKKRDEFERTIHRLMNSVSGDTMPEDPWSYHRVLYLCSNAATIENYQKKIKDGQEIPVYKRNSSRHFIETKQKLTVTKELVQRIRFTLIDLLDPSI